VQIDFAPAAKEKNGDRFLGDNRAQADAAGGKMVKAIGKGGIFVNGDRPGWFLMVAAREFKKDSAVPSASEPYEGRATLKFLTGTTNRQVVEIPAAIDETKFDLKKVGLISVQDLGSDEEFRFDLGDIKNEPANNKATMELQEIDLAPEFPLEPDGSIEQATSNPDAYLPGVGIIHGGKPPNSGYGFGTNLEVVVHADLSSAAGQSPTNTGKDNRPRFAGRTIIFTRSGAFLKPAQASLLIQGSFSTSDTVDLTIDGTTVRYTVKAGDAAGDVARGLTALVRGNATLAARFIVLRPSVRKLRIQSLTLGTADNGKAISAVTSASGATLTLNSPTLRAGGAFAPNLVKTMTHELGHAFGFPHDCGYHSWDATTPELSCVLCSIDTWLYIDPDDTPKGVRRFTPGFDSDNNLLRGPNFCGRHIRGIRSVHLEDNDALWIWK
jgi:hypothetical protein